MLYLSGTLEKLSMRKFHKDGSLPEHGEILVFGSNLAGRHGKGSALVARTKFGAIYGQGIGLQGQSYGVPTKDGRDNTFPLGDPRSTLPLSDIKEHVDSFVAFAKSHPEMQFFVVRLGCVLARHTDSDIAPLFKDAPANCSFPDAWMPWLDTSGQPSLF